MKKQKKVFTRIIIVVLVILAVITGGFLIYTANYYHADPFAVEPIENSQEYSIENDFSILAPSAPNGTGIIFYPGAKVEYTAYLPLMDQLCQQGITCVIVEMPFNLAIFGTNMADRVYAEFPTIENWYISGHSLGGAMASSYYSKNPTKLEGLILLGAYIYGDVPTENTLTIYGSEDHILNRSKITYTENLYIIEGGNHAQFGNYGAQSGDGIATISGEEQQETTAEYILHFVDS